MTSVATGPEHIIVPAGFQFAAIEAGIKYKNRLDLAVAFAPEGAAAAAVFTTNLLAAAPVQIAKAHLREAHGKIRAVLVNSGNANCAVGRVGLEACNATCEALSEALGVSSREVFPASTGVIGVPMPVDRMIASIGHVRQKLRDDCESAFGLAKAIMTTDTRPKTATARIQCGGREATLFGVAKGAGMIQPNMATMLGFLFTDASGTPMELKLALAAACNRSFNRISIDGDTSTNDTVLLMASGKSGVKVTDTAFTEALTAVCLSLAEQIVRDGEGVQHLVRLRIEGAPNESAAEQIARTVANSCLVKTAWAGADPNWGRILAAIGRSGVEADMAKVDIGFGDEYVCRNGAAVEFSEERAHGYLSQPEYEIRIHLHAGPAAITFLTCDLTAEYVRINADYRS